MDTMLSDIDIIVASDTSSYGIGACILHKMPNGSHKPVALQENETLKLLWDFEIQTDHLISARRPDDQT